MPGYKCVRQTAKLLKDSIVRDEKGISMIEVLIAILILGLVGVTFLGSIGTSTRATVINDEQSVAESLVRSEAEYVKRCAYQLNATEYPVDPSLTVPMSWAVSTVAAPVHASDDGIQEVTITAERNGESILAITVYKVAR